MAAGYTLRELMEKYVAPELAPGDRALREAPAATGRPAPAFETILRLPEEDSNPRHADYDSSGKRLKHWADLRFRVNSCYSQVSNQP